MNDEDIAETATDILAIIEVRVGEGATDLDVMDILAWVSDWYLDYRRGESLH